MSLEPKIQQEINTYRRTNPRAKKLTDEQILSVLVNNGTIKLTAEQKRSIFSNSQIRGDNTGLQIEKTAPKQNSKKTMYLQSGRKVVYSKLADGRTVMQYFGADGTPIKPEYFKKVEGQISIATDGNSYTVTKNGKKRTLKAKNPTQGAVDQKLVRLNNEEKRLNKTKKEQGLIGKGWDCVKNKTGIGDGSDKAQQQINAERKLLNQVKTGKISKKDFKNATGVEYTKENLEKFKRGELSQATAKINGYKEGQEMVADVVGDMVSGIAAVGIYTAAVAAAPFTGGASIAVGVAAATASGALIKAGVKALDTVGTDKKYTMKDFGHDLATGAFSGALAPITGGLGGAVGKTVATKLGIQAVKQVGKEVAEEVVETGVKQGLKTALTNPAGYEYVGGTLLKRGTAMAAEMATDGALGGAIDGGFRAGLDNNWDAEAMLDGAVEGGIGGAIMSPIIGGGFKTMGKGAQKVFGKENVKLDANGNRVIDWKYIDAEDSNILPMNNCEAKSTMSTYLRNHYYFDADNNKFTKNVQAQSLKYSKPLDKKYIHLDQMSKPGGTVAATSTLEQAIYTDKLYQCAALAIVDKVHNKQALIHCFPGFSVESNKQIIQHVMSQSNVKDLEISIIPGCEKETYTTVAFLIDAVNELAPDAKLNCYNASIAIHKPINVVLDNGKVTYCLDGEIKDKVVNPKGNLTFCVPTIDSYSMMKEYNRLFDLPDQNVQRRKKIKQILKQRGHKIQKNNKFDTSSVPKKYLAEKRLFIYEDPECSKQEIKYRWCSKDKNDDFIIQVYEKNGKKFIVDYEVVDNYWCATGIRAGDKIVKTYSIDEKVIVKLVNGKLVIKSQN